MLAAVNPGAQLIADGHIHVYGPLRGRAVAGAQGWPGARIFCHRLEAELVGIDAAYLTRDDLPARSRRQGRADSASRRSLRRRDALNLCAGRAPRAARSTAARATKVVQDSLAETLSSSERTPSMTMDLKRTSLDRRRILKAGLAAGGLMGSAAPAARALGAPAAPEGAGQAIGPLWPASRSGSRRFRGTSPGASRRLRTR